MMSLIGDDTAGKFTRDSIYDAMKTMPKTYVDLHPKWFINTTTYEQLNGFGQHNELADAVYQACMTKFIRGLVLSDYFEKLLFNHPLHNFVYNFDRDYEPKAINYEISKAVDGVNLISNCVERFNRRTDKMTLFVHKLPVTVDQLLADKIELDDTIIGEFVVDLIQRDVRGKSSEKYDTSNWTFPSIEYSLYSSYNPQLGKYQLEFVPDFNR